MKSSYMTTRLSVIKINNLRSIYEVELKIRKVIKLTKKKKNKVRNNQREGMESNSNLDTNGVTRWRTASDNRMQRLRFNLPE